jgi:7-cyano-7-deazaguanine reductase
MGELADNIVGAIRAKEVYALPNERPDVETEVEHEFEIHTLCPVTKNPRPGSTLTIAYTPKESVLDVIGLDAYLRRFKGGFREEGEIVVREMEHLVQRVAEDCARWVGVPVTVTVDALLTPKQRERIVSRAG